MRNYSNDVFLSYSRQDNLAVATPYGQQIMGWADAFKAFLERRHEEWTGRALRVFLDRSDIKNGDDWENRLFSELRASRLMIAFLSPNYLSSEYCRKEWQTYLRYEHSSARGFSGIKPFYYMKVSEFESAENSARLEGWLQDMRKRQAEEDFEMIDWAQNPAALEGMLRLIDAKERLSDLRLNPRDANGKLIASLQKIDESIAESLDNTTLAEMAMSRGNMRGSYDGFVGRAYELRALHKALTEAGIGTLCALHGLGGQGKTALAEQYSYAYSGFYACGGRWLVGCAGKSDILSVLQDLLRAVGIDLPEGVKNPPPEWYLATLRAYTMEGQGEVEQMRRHPDMRVKQGRRVPIVPRMLLVLDNVDAPDLLSAANVAVLKPHSDWLSIVVTTRDHPEKLGAATDFVPIPIDDLPPEDALALLAAKCPFFDDAEKAAATEMVRLLGGMTIVIDLCAAKLERDGGRSGGKPYAAMLAGIQKLGITAPDLLASDIGNAIRADARSKRVAFIVEDTISAITPPERQEQARSLLQCAAAFPPDMVVEDWLRSAVATLHPLFAHGGKTNPFVTDPWVDLIAQLTQRRVLTAAVICEGALPALRLHRHVGEHIRAAMDDETKAARKEMMAQLINELGAVFEDVSPHDPSISRAFLPGLEALVTYGLEKHHDDLRVITSVGAVAQSLIGYGRAAAGHSLLQKALDAAHVLAGREAEGASLVASMYSGLLADCLMKRGATGDSEAALALYTEGLVTCEILAADNPSSIAALRNLGVSQNTLADFFMQRGSAGDEDMAQVLYQAGLTTHEKLAVQDPNSVHALSDLSVSQRNLAGFYFKRRKAGDLEAALVLYRASLAICETVAADNPNSAQALRELSVSQERLGDFHARRAAAGDVEAALAYFTASLKTAEKLAADNPASVVTLRDLSVAQTKLGDFHAKRGAAGDAEVALTYFTASLKVDEKLALDEPSSARARADLCGTLERLADHAAGQQDWHLAVQMIERAYTLRHQIQMANTGNATRLRELIVTATRRPEFLANSQGMPAAMAALSTLLDHILDFVAQFPLDPQMQQIVEQYREPLRAASLMRAVKEVPDEVVDQALANSGFMQLARNLMSKQGIDLDSLPEDVRLNVLRQIIVQSSQQQDQT